MARDGEGQKSAHRNIYPLEGEGWRGPVVSESNKWFFDFFWVAGTRVFGWVPDRRLRFGRAGFGPFSLGLV